PGPVSSLHRPGGRAELSFPKPGKFSRRNAITEMRLATPSILYSRHSDAAVMTHELGRDRNSCFRYWGNLWRLVNLWNASFASWICQGYGRRDQCDPANS